MTPDRNWSNIEIEYVEPITWFDVSSDEELKEAFKWKNLYLKNSISRKKLNLISQIIDYNLSKLINFSS